jgi:DNA-binding transcriptional LysR family regulator
MEALTAAGRNFRIAYTSPNRSVIDAAILQGLAVAVLPEMCVRPGMRILTQAEGFAPLGTFEIGLMRKPGKQSQAADALAHHIRESFGRSAAAVIAAE